MKKLLTTLIIILITSPIKADYTMVYPLEQSKGGTLPDNSIIFADEDLTETWETFADNRGLSKDWNNLNWQNTSLSSIPSKPYPLTNTTGVLRFVQNQLTNIGGLSNLTSVNRLNLSVNNLSNVNEFTNLTSAIGLYIQFNKLTNINGLINLTNIQILYMNDNQLTNVDGLINLMNINDIQMQNNNISNINGLANLKVSTRINIDSTYSGPKLASDTRFCSLNTPEVFTIGYAQKTQLCN